MPLNDPSLLTALKAQIQIGGTLQVNTFQATFHYQMAYRVQNHSLDILVLGQDNAGDALLIDVDSNATPTTSDDDDEARSLWSSDDNEHFDPFEDDPTHPDARRSSTPNRQIKEFVQTSKFDSHQLPASQIEHLVSLSLPSDLPRHCLAQGYTHIHFGALRLALTFHGRKGLPAYSRIALLDKRQLSRDELVKLLPEKWITNYEQIHQAPVRSTSAPEFVRHENGLVEIKFSSSQSKLDNVFPTGIHMITPTDQEPAQEIKHIWWDVCNYEGCLDEAAKINDDDEDLPKKQKSSQRKLKRRFEKGDPTVGLLGEPSGKFDYYVLYTKAEPTQPPWEHTAHAREEFLKMKCCSF
nr:putative zinc finger, CCHC-type [Tanacetum cinerariifolium]